MQFTEFKQQLNNFVVFDLQDIRKIEVDFDLRRLSEWQDSGYIKIVRRGYYIFSDLEINEQVLFLIANNIYEPSYVSCEMALSFYGLIPEGVYSVTSISSKKTSKFKTLIAEFSYRKVKPELFFGYKLMTVGNQQYKIAEIEKTVLDYLYLNPQMQNEANFSEWRFNAQDFLAKANLEKFNKYLKVFGSKQLNKRAEKFLKFIKQ
jgi:predicted transcriptional regulator of viral defense system